MPSRPRPSGVAAERRPRAPSAVEAERLEAEQAAVEQAEADQAAAAAAAELAAGPRGSHGRRTQQAVREDNRTAPRTRRACSPSSTARHRAPRRGRRAGARGGPVPVEVQAETDTGPAPMVARDHADTAMLLRELASLGFGADDEPPPRRRRRRPGRRRSAPPSTRRRSARACSAAADRCRGSCGRAGSMAGCEQWCSGSARPACGSTARSSAALPAARPVRPRRRDPRRHRGQRGPAGRQGARAADPRR